MADEMVNATAVTAAMDLDEPEAADEGVKPRPGELPGSYVSSDAGILLSTERTNATPGDTYEGVRDNEQLGRTRNQLLQEVQEISPPAADGAYIQNDQIGRQVASGDLKARLDPGTSSPDAANTDEDDDISLGKLPGGHESVWK
jgi:hypothetical protein